MHWNGLGCRSLPLAALLEALAGCAPLPQSYLNTTHPHYGATEYLADLSQCRNESSSVVTSIQDETHSTARVNDVQTEGCMSRHGWAPASTAIAWSPPLYWWPIR